MAAYEGFALLPQERCARLSLTTLRSSGSLLKCIPSSASGATSALLGSRASTTSRRTGGKSGSKSSSNLTASRGSPTSYQDGRR